MLKNSIKSLVGCKSFKSMATVPSSVCAVMLLAINTVHANPASPDVIAGDVTFNENAGQFIVEASDGAIVNWESFNIDANEVSQFNISNDGAMLNRVVGLDASLINGYLGSNGTMYLINPNGIILGEGSVVQTANFLASTLDINNNDFGSNSTFFSAEANADSSITASGVITIAENGNVLLFGSDVTNNGEIQAPDGHVFMIAANRLTLVNAENPTVSVDVTQNIGEAINNGDISAEGGQVDLEGMLVKNCDCIQANSLVETEYGDLILINDTAGQGTGLMTREVSTVTQVPDATISCAKTAVEVPELTTEVEIFDALDGVATGLASAITNNQEDEPANTSVLPDQPAYQPPCV